MSSLLTQSRSITSTNGLRSRLALRFSVPLFIPGNAATTFCHVVAWEVMFDTVSFQHFSLTKFSRLLNAVLIHGVTISRIGFIDYPLKHVPQFDLQQVSDTKVERFRFLCCCQKMDIDFVDVIRDVAIDITRTDSTFAAVRELSRSEAASDVQTVEASHEILPRPRISPIRNGRQPHVSSPLNFMTLDPNKQDLRAPLV